VNTNFPHIDTSQYEEWACLRPMTPNMMPIVGASESRSDVYYHTGHGHLGWTLSAGTAKNLATQINERI
jgi:D-amino-acid dehydrogenase